MRRRASLATAAATLAAPAVAQPARVPRLVPNVDLPVLDPDLLPPLHRDRNLVVAVNDQTGVAPILSFNSLHGPFDNAAVRRAVAPAALTSNHQDGQKRRPGGSGITNWLNQQTISYAPWADVLL